MAQAYPQFTPVQILEAGERALADGRTEYAAQFFQHLVDHYSSTPEAAAARDAMARMNGADLNGAQHAHHDEQPVQYSQPNRSERHAAPGDQGYQNGYGEAPRHAPVYTPKQDQSAGHARSHGDASTNGYQNGLANGYAPAYSEQRAEPSFNRPAPRRPDQAPAYPAPQPAPRGSLEHARHVTHQAREPEPRLPPQPAHHLIVPAPEKNYIVGRVISGLLLFIGIVGIFAGIILVYAAATDPAIFARVGIGSSGQAVIFSVSVFLGSVAMLIVSQMATALFDGADAVADLARLERFRAGDAGDLDD